jgi:hypothetical protein
VIHSLNNRWCIQQEQSEENHCSAQQSRDCSSQWGCILAAELLTGFGCSATACSAPESILLHPKLLLLTLPNGSFGNSELRIKSLLGIPPSNRKQQTNNCKYLEETTP